MLLRSSLCANIVRNFFNNRRLHYMQFPLSAICPPKELEIKKDTQQVTFPRPVRKEFPAKVRMGILPDDWFVMMYNKTGVTGPYTVLFTVIAFLLSKEYYVLDHEYYNGLSVAMASVITVKKVGPKVAAYADKEVDACAEMWESLKKKTIEDCEDSIAAEKKAQWQADGQNMLMNAKRENVALQLEAEYRERLMQAYKEVKRLLDYQVEKHVVETRVHQKHIVEWVKKNVVSSLTPEMEKDIMKLCISELKGLKA